jgi:hypothetical protein
MTAKTHSPFHVVEDFISPANCEKIIATLGIAQPSLAEDGRPLKNERLVKDADLVQLIQQAILANGKDIQDRFNGIIKGMETPHFQQYFEDAKHPCEAHSCENSSYLRKKWVKTKDIDLVGYLWLKDYGSGVPLDPRVEVYGGKLEFPAYNFSLVPQRGTMVMFPAGPHFITAVSPVMVGSLEQIKFTIKLTTTNDGIWLYQPSNFGGTYTDWFN